MTEKKLKCLCIDDETHALDLLEMYIEKTPFLSLSFRTSDAWEGLKKAEEEAIDIIFLDIQMDTINGIQFMEILKKKTNIILTTAYEEYALKSYEFAVKDYLLKPFSFARFLKAALKVKEDNNAQIIFEPEVKQESDNQYILIKSDAKHKYFRVKKSDILYVESLRNYVRFYLKDQKLISLQTLNNALESLGSPFQRVHKSFVINMDCIDMVDGNMIYINNQSIPIGNSYRKEFFLSIKKI